MTDSSNSSLDNTMGCLYSAIRLLFGVLLSPLLLAFWMLVLLFYLYVGIPAYLIKHIVPSAAPAIDSFFNKASTVASTLSLRFITFFLT